MVSSFQEFGLSAELIQAVESLGFEQPTPIQLAAIPVLLAGRDVVGQAQTGTGKTAAFGLPLLQKIQPGEGFIQALVLSPTRELAIQVAEAISRMGKQTSARVLAVYGGQSYQVQTRQLDRGVDIVVGTPGRLLDLMRQKRLDLSKVSHLILDEADEMLEMGFIDDVETILKAIPAERQIGLFSATMPEVIRKLSKRYLTDPQTISINPTHLTVAETEQHFIRVREESKLAALTRILEIEDVKSGLIFAKTKARAQELSEELVRRGYPAGALHGDLNQSRREYVLNRFRQNSITLLVATDVAARGLDIENVSHVFNYDVPGDPEDYVHRIGRTGRAGRKGIAITFLTPRERSRLSQIESYTHTHVDEMPIPSVESIQARRDEHFIERLTTQLGNLDHSRERDLITRLADTGIDLLDLAAAAVQLARSDEVEFKLEEIKQPAAERSERRERSDRRSSGSRWQKDSSGKSESRNSINRGAKKTPNRGENTWQKGDSISWQDKKHVHEAGMVRLLMNLGNEQGIRPGDIVGAIAGEVGIPGKAIGEIDIHRDHTFVDVAEIHVKRVLQESRGRYNLRGIPVLLKLAD
jgi:ATP-dependent RNA helicase DeaD